MDELGYWENETEYDKHIISVFKIDSILSDYLKNYPNKNICDVIDFGCGVGHAIPYLTGFKNIYAVDFSQNMLKQAQANYAESSNIQFITGDLKSTILQPVELILAVASVMPKDNDEFEQIINNFLANLKENGQILMVLPSFESNTLLFHYKADYFKKEGWSNKKIQTKLRTMQEKQHYSPFGHLMTSIKLPQKHWLKEEIEFRLDKFSFNKIAIEKLQLDWVEQIPGHAVYKDYPKLWFWLVTIQR